VEGGGVEGGGVEWKEKEDWMTKEGRRKKKKESSSEQLVAFLLCLQSPDIYVVYFFCS